jgi:hypothetical protein
MNELTTSELADYKRLLATVHETKESAATFYDTLHQIHDRKLYRQDYKTWEEFAAKELGLSARALTFKLVAHAIRKEIGNTVSEMSDRTTRALKATEPNMRKTVAKKAIKIAAGKPVTPKHIATANSSIARNYSERRPDLSVYCSGPVSRPTVATPPISPDNYTADFAPRPKPAIPPNPPPGRHTPQPPHDRPTPAPDPATHHPSRDERLLELLHQIEQHCPCGARPESPDTHPHVLGCPVDLAIVLLTT